MNTPKTLVASALALAFAVTGCSHLPSTTDTTPATGVKEMAEAPLTIQTYNPGEEAIFAVSSTLVQGKKDAVLIDAQFSAEDARKLAAQIKASGKRLVAIYISHSDPDFYFGLDTLKGEFPEVRIVATPQTVAAIEQNKDIKLKVWGPQLGENAPKNIIIPEPLDGDRLKLEGQTLQVVGLDGPTPDRTFVWIPSIRVVAGGIPVVAGEHVWMADTQTPHPGAEPVRGDSRALCAGQCAGPEGRPVHRRLHPRIRRGGGQGHQLGRADLGHEGSLPPAGRRRVPGPECQGGHGRDAVALTGIQGCVALSSSSSASSAWTFSLPNFSSRRR